VNAMLVPALMLVHALGAGTLPARAAPKEPEPVWLGTELPLPLSVRTPRDLALKALAERQYLIFNLLAGGKLAWDRGDFAQAAAKWEALLALPDLPADVAQGVRPFAQQARARAGGAPESTAASAPLAVTAPKPVPKPRRVSPVTVRGTVEGGGARGPGGAVVWLERADGKTPRPHVSGHGLVIQKHKAFVPRVLVVPVGETVAFRNDDDLYHDVFSLSTPNSFDLGLYKGGKTRSETFRTPGPVQLLCNIHASMLGWIYVVKSPWYAQADASGRFEIRDVPPGQYRVKAWHEASAHVSAQEVTVGDGGATVSLTVAADAAKPPFVPDKYGKPRQIQLGY